MEARFQTSILSILVFLTTVAILCRIFAPSWLEGGGLPAIVTFVWATAMSAYVIFRAYPLVRRLHGSSPHVQQRRRKILAQFSEKRKPADEESVE